MKKMDNKRIEQILTGMEQVRVAVVGDLMLDRYVWGDVERISPEAPVPIVRLRGESSNLGGAANVAANVGTLGAEVQLFGVIGDDSDGEKLNDLISRGNFGNSGVVTAPSRQTIVKTRIIAGSQHVVRIDRESTEALDHAVERKLLVRFRAALGGIDAVILEDYNKGVLMPDLIRAIIDSCNEAHVPVGVDPKLENFWSYENATVFKPNMRELEAALGHTIHDEEMLIEAGTEIKQRMKLKHLLVTRGKQGMVLFSGKSVKKIQTQAHRVHDVSGAGDTVIATIMTSLAAGANISEAAYLANCAASVVIAEVGAVPVDLQKLKHTCISN